MGKGAGLGRAGCRGRARWLIKGMGERPGAGAVKSAGEGREGRGRGGQ